MAKAEYQDEDQGESKPTEDKKEGTKLSAPAKAKVHKATADYLDLIEAIRAEARRRVVIHPPGEIGDVLPVGRVRVVDHMRVIVSSTSRERFRDLSLHRGAEIPITGQASPHALQFENTIHSRVELDRNISAVRGEREAGRGVDVTDQL